MTFSEDQVAKVIAAHPLLRPGGDRECTGNEDCQHDCPALDVQGITEELNKMGTEEYQWKSPEMQRHAAIRAEMHRRDDVYVKILKRLDVEHGEWEHLDSGEQAVRACIEAVKQLRDDEQPVPAEDLPRQVAPVVTEYVPLTLNCWFCGKPGKVLEKRAPQPDLKALREETVKEFQNNLVDVERGNGNTEDAVWLDDAIRIVDALLAKLAPQGGK